MESRLKRGLFGYSRNSVDAVVNDRDISIVGASREAQEAKDELATTSGELGERRIEIADLQARNRDLESKLDDAARRLRAVEGSGSTTTTEGMTDALHAAEQALARLTDEARRNSEGRLGVIEQVRDSLRTEIDRLIEWRTRMAPLAESVPDSIQHTRKEIATVSERLREALAPTTDALDTLAARLSDLAQVPDAPGRVEPEEREVVSLGEATTEKTGDVDPDVFALGSDRQAPTTPEQDRLRSVADALKLERR